VFIKAVPRGRAGSTVFASFLLLALAWTASVAGTSDPVNRAKLLVTFGSANFEIPEGATRDIFIRLNRPLNDDDPPQVSVDYTVESGVAEAGRDYVQPPPQTLTFVRGGPFHVLLPLEALDDGKHEGTERLILRLSNPVDLSNGLMQAAASIIDDDPYDPLLLDDFESDPYLWNASDNVVLDNPEIGADDPQALPGQGEFEGVLEVTAPIHVDIDVRGRLCNPGKGVVPVVLRTTDNFDATTVDPTTVTLGDAYETHVDRKTGLPRRHPEDSDGDGDLDLVFHFRFEETGLPCDPDVVPFSGRTYDGRTVTGGAAQAGLRRDFAAGTDWSGHDRLKLWFYGQNTGDEITVELLDNRAPDPGPDGWGLVWADEFNEPAGTPPDPAHWGHEIGDGTVNGIPGWGNRELQYYTDSTDNAATDGLGNLVITAREADGSLQCFYGPCRYTSARLISWHRREFAYGRIESRILVPDGDRGLWPAFWSLGTNIDRVGWPRSGEIDLMEYVSREPFEVFGTVHGPGYSGGAAFGDTWIFYPERVAASYHTFAIEWQPDRIEWYVDDILYHTATPAAVAPAEWVFNAPEFLILNMAVGGFFGGPVSPDTTFPQALTIDYVRVYQGPDTAERWQTSFTDSFVGWREVELPFGAFVRSEQQPMGAPDDGLNLDEVWGYGFRLPAGSTTGRVLLDQTRLGPQ
jgi:beta-glucanase (GH16 family)